MVEGKKVAENLIKLFSLYQYPNAITIIKTNILYIYGAQRTLKEVHTFAIL
jgi:hypothetical protein